MRYWAKIILGAFAIFAVGYGGVWFVRTQVSRGRHMIESADPITIPLAFLPFNLDGRRYGTFQRVTIRREAPKVVEGLDLRIRLADSAALAALTDCRLTMASRTNFDVSTGFHCLAVGQTDSGLVQFGSVLVSLEGAGELTLPLLLDSAVVVDMKKQDQGVSVATQGFGQGEGRAAEAQADRIRVEVKLKTDSIAGAVREKASRPTPPPAKPN
jgi:hypothetical protein